MPLEDDTTDEAWIRASTAPSPSLHAPALRSSVAPVGTEDEQNEQHINHLPPALLHSIFGHLGPRDLAAVSVVCQLWRDLNTDKAANKQWKQFYTSRWRVLGPSGEDVSWQTKYGSKMKQGKVWSGKYESDNLWGHKAGVKALKLLPSQGVLLTGSLDRTIRLWDLTYGMPLSISRPHGGTVRAVALDHTLIASGSSDNVVRLWHARRSTDGSTLLDPAEASAAAADAGITAGDMGLAESLLLDMDGPTDSDDQATASDQTPGLTAAAVAAVNANSSSSRRHAGRGPYSVITGEADEGLFDLSLPGQYLRGHIGPVTSLCMTDSCLYSGSWDYSVRVWRRCTWDCVSVLKYPDWVYSVAARGGLLLVASGPEVHVHDLPTGKLVRKFQNLHEGNVSSLEGTHSGRLLFTGGADGLLMAHDLRMKEASRVLWHHNASVNGLALEDPWLVSAASDGTVIMHNLEVALPNNFSGCVGPSSGSSASPASSGNSSSTTSIKRTLGCPGQSGPLYCVDMAESWLAAGGESPAVRTWDFTRAAEAAARAAAARAARGSSKRAAKLRKAAAAGTAAATGLGQATAAQPSSKASGAGKKGPKSSMTVSGNSSGSAVVASNCTAASSSIHGPAPAAAVSMQGPGGAGRSSSSSGSRLPRGLLAAAAAAAPIASAAGSLSSTPPGGVSSRADRFHKLHSRRSSRQAGTQGNISNGSSAGGGSSSGATTADTTAADADDCGLHAAAASSSKGGSSSGSGRDAGHGSSGHKGSNHGSSNSYGSSPQAGLPYWHGLQQQQPGSAGSSPAQHGVWLGGSSPPVGSSRLHTPSGNSSRRQSNSSGAGVQQQQPAGVGAGAWGIPIPAARRSSQQQRRRRRRLGCYGDAAASGSFEHGGWVAYGASPSAVADVATSPSYPCPAAHQGRGGRRAAAAPAGAEGCYQQGSTSTNHQDSRGRAGASAAPAAAAPYFVPFSSSYPSAAQGPGPWLVHGSSPRYEVWGTTLRIATATNGDRRLAIKQPEGHSRKSCDGGRGDDSSSPARGASPTGGGTSVTLAAGSISN